MKRHLSVQMNVPPANRRDDVMRNETLKDINQNITSLPPLEERRMRLLERIRLSGEQVKNLKEIYAARERRVDEFQRHSVSAKFQKFTGHYSKKLDKATTEMLSSKFDYEKEREHLRDLNEENEDLMLRISNLKQQQAVMQDEIIRREKEISTNRNHDLNDTYKKIQAESTVTAKQLVENDEALKAAQKVLGSAKASLEELENAEQWVTSDIWGASGLVGRTTKLSKIDHAQSTFNRLSTQIVDLERELGDVNLVEKTLLSTISSTNHMVESWFDNILSSQDVTVVLRRNQVQLRVLVTQVKALIENLEKNEEDLAARLHSLDQEKADLIVTCHSCQSEDGEEAACSIVSKV